MEISYLNTYDMLVPITGRDADIFRELGCRVPIHVAPTGVFTGDYTPDREKVDFPSVFHIGALDWAPNQEGLYWFIENIWRAISSKYPDLKFYIAGRNAPEKIKNIKERNVEFLGEVEDAHEFMNSKAVMVVPLLSGSGMRIKIIEGMALGKAIVSTSIGAEGIHCEHGNDLLIADQPDDFISELESLLNNFDKFESLSKKASQFVGENYDNLVITSSLLDFYHKHL
jgi:glycosyltransferase involved in cell wall biosynthesis